MSKITKNIGYAILWLHHNSRTPLEIAKELKLTEKQVLSFLEKNNSTNKLEENKLPVKQSPVKKSKDLMIMHTRDKRVNNVAIMTKEASEINDEMKKQLRHTNKKLDYIFNPNERK